MKHYAYLISIVCLACIFYGCPKLVQMQPDVADGGRGVAIAVSPADEKVMIVASETGGLFRTKDGGLTWSHVSGHTTFFYSDVMFLPTDANVVIAAARDDFKNPTGGGIWRSDNGGSSWTQMSISPMTTACADIFSVFCLGYESDHGRIWAGTQCGLIYSDDGGVVWNVLAPVSGLGDEKVYAVIATDSANLKILTNAGVKISTNAGSDWAYSNSGLPSNINKGVHNQIAVSPYNSDHIYWAFNYWFWDTTASDWQGRLGLYLSTDNGSSWTSVIDNAGINRPPFVRIANSLSAGTNKYDVYWGNGRCTFQRSTATHGSPPSFSSWTGMPVDHCDASDVSFKNDQKSPLLLTSDGGVHITTDNGANWHYPSSGRTGYAALQITEVTGQMHSDGNSFDLYYATQDNDIRASGDGGATWPGKRCCEGFLLNIPRNHLPAADTKLTGVSCAGCGNFISGPVLTSQASFPNPPNDAGNPRLIKPGYYIQNTKISGLPGNVFDLTTNTGGVWTPRYGFQEDVVALSELSWSGGNPVIFTAIKGSGTTPTGEQILEIKKIVDVLGIGTPVVSNISGFGSLGIFPTMFAWYKPYGVDPGNPNHIIVPDIVDEKMKYTTDGGLVWQDMDELTDLITEYGNSHFREKSFTQLSTIAFDPTCSVHVLAGTRQAGIFESFDRGYTWTKVRGSKNIPLVSSFFFAGNNKVIISSYGRGLWRYKYKKCPPIWHFPVHFVQLDVPLIYYMGAYIPLSQLGDPGVCPVCGFFLIRGGEIYDYKVNPKTQVLEEVTISSGKIVGFSQFRNKEIELPFKVIVAGEGVRSAVAQVHKMENSDKSVPVKGFYLENNLFKGIVISDKDVSVDQLPKVRHLGPYLRVEVPDIGENAAVKNNAIVIYGFNWNRNFPLDVRIDDERINLDENSQPPIDEKGNFVLQIPPIYDIGGHTLRVSQKTDDGVLEDVTIFRITTRDFDENKEQ